MNSIAHPAAESIPQPRYITDLLCLSSSPAGTAKYAVTVTTPDGRTAPARSNLLVKRNGYSSAAGLGSWPSMAEAISAIEAEAARWLEARQ